MKHIGNDANKKDYLFSKAIKLSETSKTHTRILTAR